MSINALRFTPWGANMDDALLDVVLTRLDAKPLANEAASLLLAAFESETALHAQLSGDSALTPEHRLERPAAEPAGAYLRSISVCGFRGVGPPSTLELEPGPVLTLVVGGNGSGKSSFADGLEVLLTGALGRWQELSAVWQEAWRNLHAPDPVRITAELVIKGGCLVAQATQHRGMLESYASVAGSDPQSRARPRRPPGF
jgi:hypothetical protein